MSEKKKIVQKNNLAKLRESNNLTQQDIADVWGCNSALVSRIENHSVGMTRQKEDQLFKVYGWGYSDLFCDAGRKVPILGYVGAGEQVLPVDDLPLVKKYISFYETFLLTYVSFCEILGHRNKRSQTCRLPNRMIRLSPPPGIA